MSKQADNLLQGYHRAASVGDSQDLVFEAFTPNQVSYSCTRCGYVTVDSLLALTGTTPVDRSPLGWLEHRTG